MAKHAQALVHQNNSSPSQHAASNNNTAAVDAELSQMSKSHNSLYPTPLANHHHKPAHDSTTPMQTPRQSTTATPPTVVLDGSYASVKVDLYGEDQENNSVNHNNITTDQDQSTAAAATAATAANAAMHSKARTEQEWQDVADFFAANPDRVQPVLQILKKYGCKSVDRQCDLVEQHWRNVIRYLVRHGDDDEGDSNSNNSRSQLPRELKPTSCVSKSEGKRVSQDENQDTERAPIACSQEKSGLALDDAHRHAADAHQDHHRAADGNISPTESSHVPDAAVDSTDGYYIADLGRVLVQYAKFKKHLPTVHPFYAAKCNGAMPLLEMISACGGGFDCASFEEFRVVLANRLAPPEKIIFANPQKKPSHLQAAERCNIRWITFDSEKELEKIKTNMPSAQAVLRIRTDDSAALCQFSIKFGAVMSETQYLLERAKELGVAVVGVSFHVGSGNNDPNAYISAIRNARTVFDYGISIGHEMKLLDIGGGMPGAPPPIDPATNKPTALSFEEIAASIRPSLTELFSNATVIGEPGRYFAESTFAMALCVHGVRTVAQPSTGLREYQYFLGDGLYGAFNCIFYDHAKPNICVLEPDPEARIHLSTLWGPTCDSMDCLLRLQPFPELDLYEWVFVPNFGAYTMAAGSAFNGYKTDQCKYVCSVPMDCVTGAAKKAAEASNKKKSEFES